MFFTLADDSHLLRRKLETNIIHNMMETNISPTDDQHAHKANQKEAIVTLAEQ